MFSFSWQIAASSAAIFARPILKEALETMLLRDGMASTEESQSFYRSSPTPPSEMSAGYYRRGTDAGFSRWEELLQDLELYCFMFQDFQSIGAQCSDSS